MCEMAVFFHTSVLAVCYSGNMAPWGCLVSEEANSGAHFDGPEVQRVRLSPGRQCSLYVVNKLKRTKDQVNLMTL